MKKIKKSVQELYQEKAVTEFHMSLKEGSTIEEALIMRQYLQEAFRTVEHI